MKPLEWVSLDARVIATIAVEVALMLAILRFVLRKPRARLLAVLGFTILVAAQGIGYDFFGTVPIDEVVSRPLGDDLYVYYIEVRTRLLGYPRLRINAVVWDPQHALRRVPRLQFSEHGDSVWLLTRELAGIDRVFVVAVRSGGPRVYELPKSIYNQMTEEILDREIGRAVDRGEFR